MPTTPGAASVATHSMELEDEASIGNDQSLHSIQSVQSVQSVGAASSIDDSYSVFSSWRSHYAIV